MINKATATLRQSGRRPKDSSGHEDTRPSGFEPQPLRRRAVLATEPVDNRRGADRRAAEPIAEFEGDDRRKTERRRQIDPTTCERDYLPDQVEFMRAMDDYKRRSGRQFPTWSEVLEVVCDLGYRKVAAPMQTYNS